MLGNSAAAEWRKIFLTLALHHSNHGAGLSPAWDILEYLGGACAATALLNSYQHKSLFLPDLSLLIRSFCYNDELPSSYHRRNVSFSPAARLML